MPPTGTMISSLGAIPTQVRLPATTVVGLNGLARMSASNGTPYSRAMLVGLSPNFTL
jgi:hypothetical protein